MKITREPVNKKLLASVAIAIVGIAAIALIVSDSFSVSGFFRTMSGMNPRVLSLVALPFIVVLLVIGNYFRKKNEERKWKEALKRTRANKEAEDAAKKAAREKATS